MVPICQLVRCHVVPPQAILMPPATTYAQWPQLLAVSRACPFRAHVPPPIGIFF
jgi:hypothetical protein